MNVCDTGIDGPLCSCQACRIKFMLISAEADMCASYDVKEDCRLCGVTFWAQSDRPADVCPDCENEE